MPKETITPESLLIGHSKSGTVFYTPKKDRHLTTIATRINRKIKTERMVALNTGRQAKEVEYLTKVTIL